MVRPLDKLSLTEQMPLNEADTCRTYVLPKLHDDGWELLAEWISLLKILQGETSELAFLTPSIGSRMFRQSTTRPSERESHGSAGHT